MFTLVISYVESFNGVVILIHYSMFYDIVLVLCTGVGSMGASGACAPMKFLSAWNTHKVTLCSEVFFMLSIIQCTHRYQSTRLPKINLYLPTPMLCVPIIVEGCPAGL